MPISQPGIKIKMVTNSIDFVDVTHIYESAPKSGKESVKYVALKDFSLSVADGEFLSVVGPTGCGKSTILNLAAGLLRPSAGHIDIYGQSHTASARTIGYLFQSDTLMAWRTALSNTTLGLEYRGVDRHERERKARAWLQKVGLSGAEGKYPHELSGGMRRRVSLAQMLVMEPDIILMDEPFSALDAQTRLLMENEVLEIWAENKRSVLFITHDLEEAISMSDRVIVLSSGPETHPIGDFIIDMERPRNLTEIRYTRRFNELYNDIWSVMKDEVLRGYRASLAL